MGPTPSATSSCGGYSVPRAPLPSASAERERDDNDPRSLELRHRLDKGPPEHRARDKAGGEELHL